MKQVHDIIEQLRTTPGSKDKLALLKDNAGDQELKEYLRVTYEDHINFFMTKVEPGYYNGLTSDTNHVINFDLDRIAEIVHHLHNRIYTGHDAKTNVARIYHNLCNKWERELLCLMIDRNVQAGISAGTINKVWPDLIKIVPYQRCSLHSDTDLTKWPWSKGIASQIKADGMYANISHQLDGSVTIESRAGRPFPLEYFAELVQSIKLQVPKGNQLHGELLMSLSSEILPRQIGNGEFNSILKGGELSDGYSPIYQAWDMIPISEAFSKNKYRVPYTERFDKLSKTISSNDSLSLIEHKTVYSLAEAKEHARQVMLKGFEGTVIKHPEGIWADGTSKDQIKLKLEFECELLVVGFNDADATSKHASTFGSLICESSDGLLQVGVTGLKDDVRAAMHANRKAMINFTVITVKANGIMSPTKPGGLASLFLPRYIETRDEKKGIEGADSLQRITEIQKAAIEAGI